MVISSQETKDYEQMFAEYVKIYRKELQPFSDDARLSVDIDWTTDSRRQDVDSPAKVILDCLQKNGVIKNDNRVDALKITRTISGVPGVNITIEEVKR